MKRVLLGIIFLMAAQSACANASDVGMITQLNGNVTVARANKAKVSATAFLKVALGDKLVLEKSARVRIVYFETDRQELWTGAGEIEIADGEGRSRALKPEVKKLPPLIVQQLENAPQAGRHGKSAMVIVRSGDSGSVESLEKQYEELRSRVSADDTTPEIFLLTGLLDLKKYKYAGNVLEKFKANLGNKPELATVISHFEPVIDELSRDHL
jgi:hypothetical protein